MLIKLYVHNYALIRDLDIDFDDGLTIITGETGAGKTKHNQKNFSQMHEYIDFIFKNRPSERFQTACVR